MTDHTQETATEGALGMQTNESRLIMIAARWEWICDLLAGREVSDFALSFPEVREVADLIAIRSKP